MKLNPASLFIVNAAICILFSTAELSHGNNLYTSIDPDRCWSPEKQVVARYEAQGLEVQECKGTKGWKLLIASSDERSWVDLQDGEVIWSTENEVVYNNEFGYFPNIGSRVVEWIVTPENEPLSLIFRINAQSAKKGAPLYAKVSRLFVISLRHHRPTFCGTASTNEEARSVAIHGSCKNQLPMSRLSTGKK